MFSFIAALDITSVMLLFLFTLIFDLPRYLFNIVLINCCPKEKLIQKHFTTSAVIAGYNEEKSIRDCVESLGAVDQIIVIDDGSSDNMWSVMTELYSEKKVSKIIKLSQRSSKILAINEGLKYVENEIVFIIDADTIFKSDTVSNALCYFNDPIVGGVSCNLEVRNENKSLITLFQAIEYKVSVTIGKQISDFFGIMHNISGACGAFRYQALKDVNFLDVEVAEDANLSMKLRQNGWKLRFAPDATAVTNVPETLINLTLQRLRWDSTIITIYFRKFRYFFNPFRKDFYLLNVFTLLDVYVFSLFLILLLPIYIIWLYSLMGSFTFFLIGVIFICLTVVEIIIFFLIGLPLRLILYVPFYVFVQTFIMKPVRIISILSELIFYISLKDSYIPENQRHKLYGWR